MQISLFLSVITWAFALVPNVQCRAIFAHYMVGSVTEQHVKIDIDQAQAAGIQGFSLNIGDPSKSFVSDTLRYMFAYAPTVGFHLHISMDIWASGDATGGHPELFNKLLNQYMHAPGYFTFNNLPYVTTFSDGGLNHTTWATWRASVPAHYFCPNFDGTAGGMSGDDGWWFYWGDYLDCIFTWESAWPVRPGQSKGSASQGSIEVDLTLLKSARARGKTYNMPISSLQYKNAYSTSVYREGDLTLVKRLLNIVSLGPDLAPDFVTIITWNDGPEGHYVGNIWPEQNTDDDPARYVYAGTRWDHGAWRPLIKAFAGAYMSGTIGMLPTGNTGVEGAMWYSGVMKSSVCPSGSYVDNWEAGGDQVNFAISSSTSLSNLEVRITSGGHVAVYTGIGPGTNYAAAPKYPGQQLLEVFSGGTRIAVAQGGRCVSSQCPDRIYNMNPIVVGIHNPNSAPAPVLCEDPVCANPNSLQITLRQPTPSRAFRALQSDHKPLTRLLAPRQSEDYNTYIAFPDRIDKEFMLGATGDDGNRLPRENCIFYVNQKDMPKDDPNLGKTRAVQFAALMNAQYPGHDYHTLYNVYSEAAFMEDREPFLSATQAKQQRKWFQVTSEEYAKLCTGTVFLIVEKEPQQIWDQSIWMTHEWPAIRDGGQVSLILEVRPEDVGQVLDEGPGAIRYISHYLYRGGQAPGSTPPRDTGPTEIAACIDVDEAAGHQWDNFPDVSGDVSPFKEGVCSMHVKEWDNSESGGGGPFDDPNRAYSVEVTLFDDGATHKIGFAERTNAPLSMQSKLDTLFDVTVVKSNGYLQFQLGTVVFESDDTSCSVGKWDHGENRQMDCTFPCSWGGGDSTDGLDVDEWYP